MWQGPHGQNESAQRQRSEVALTALHTTGKGILAKMLTFVFDKSKFSVTLTGKENLSIQFLLFISAHFDADGLHQI